MYHLKQLIRSGLVEKVDDGYSLTNTGKHYTERSNLPTMKLRVQPKQITILVVEVAPEKYLLLKRTHLPYFDFIGFPSGKIHYGEKLQDAAERELLEKSGLTGVTLQLRGNVLMRFMDETGEVSSHVNGYIFSGKTDAPNLIHETEFYTSYTGSKADLFTDKSFKGHKEIFELLEKYPDVLFLEDLEFVADF